MSQANNPITLKLHHGDDIRRFHLEKLDWEELTKLISSTYPSPYTLKYRDTDNDLVTMVAQQDLQDANDMSQGDVIHLYVMDQTTNPTHDQPPSTGSPDVDMKSSQEDNLASQLSHDEISTLLSECLSDPTIVNAIPPFLTTFIDQFTVNLSNANPLSTSWTQTLQQHRTIRDHAILSVLFPRMEQALTRADSNNMASRIPAHVLPMVKGFLPMLPMFLPTLVPMFTKFMSDTTTAPTEAQGNPFANSPLASMLGPMLSGMQQPAPQAASPSSSSSTTSPPNSNPAAPFNPLSVLGPLLAGAAANPGASAASASPSNAAPQAQSNPLLGLLGPLLAANIANTGNPANINPLASLLQQYAQAPHDNAAATANSNSNNNNNPADYTEQLAQLDSMGVGNHELNLALLRQCDGSVERVVQLLAQE